MGGGGRGFVGMDASFGSKVYDSRSLESRELFSL